MGKRIIETFTAADEAGNHYTIRTVQRTKLFQYLGGETEMQDDGLAYHEWNGHAVIKLADEEDAFYIRAIDTTVRRIRD